MFAVVAIIHKSEHAFGVSFPDFPGAVSGGSTETEALQRAREGLAVHIEAMVEDGEDIPALRSVEELRSDPEFADDFREAVAIALVEADIPGKSVRLNISLDENLVQRIDRKAKERGETRSGFIASAARQLLVA